MTIESIKSKTGDQENPNGKHMSRRDLLGFFRKKQSEEKEEVEFDNEKKKIKLFRRDILFLLAGGMAGFGAAYHHTISSGYDHLCYEIKRMRFNNNHSAEFNKNDPNLIQNLESRYNLTLKFNQDEWYIPSEQKSETLEILKKAFSVYPPELISSKNFNIELQLLPFFEYESDKHAIVNNPNIPVDVGGYQCPSAENNQRHTMKLMVDEEMEGTIHHELYHAFSLGQICKYSKHVIGETFTGCHPDFSWIDLNPNGEDDYLFDREKVFSEDSETSGVPLGFVSEYAMINACEDQAEAASSIFADPENLFLKLEVLKDQDPVLFKKIERVLSDYYKWSNGKMDNQYCIDISSGRVGEGYWNEEYPK